jgi:hypothetical protein
MTLLAGEITRKAKLSMDFKGSIHSFFSFLSVFIGVHRWLKNEFETTDEHR